MQWPSKATADRAMTPTSGARGIWHSSLGAVGPSVTRIRLGPAVLVGLFSALRPQASDHPCHVLGEAPSRPKTRAVRAQRALRPGPVVHVRSAVMTAVAAAIVFTPATHKIRTVSA